MKLNKKGFMLAEVVVVSAVVATVLVTMYIAVTRLSSAYSKRDKYHDLDAMYLAMTANDMYRTTMTNCQEVGDTKELTSNEYTELSNIYKDNGYADVRIFYSPYNKDNLKKINDSKVTTKNYIDYISGNLDFSESDYHHIIVAELCKDQDDCYYYALKARCGVYLELIKGEGIDKIYYRIKGEDIWQSTDDTIKIRANKDTNYEYYGEPSSGYNNPDCSKGTACNIILSQNTKIKLSSTKEGR